VFSFLRAIAWRQITARDRRSPERRRRLRRIDVEQSSCRPTAPASSREARRSSPSNASMRRAGRPPTPRQPASCTSRRYPGCARTARSRGLSPPLRNWRARSRRTGCWTRAWRRPSTRCPGSSSRGQGRELVAEDAGRGAHQLPEPWRRAETLTFLHSTVHREKGALFLR
jgi:hypothetical protein